MEAARLLEKRRKLWREKGRKWRKTHPGYFNAMNKHWIDTHRDRAKAERCIVTSKLKASRQNVPHTITIDWIHEKILAAKDCPVCGIELNLGIREPNQKKGPKYNSFSMDRTIPEYGYTEENVKIMCHKCNLEKGQISPLNIQKWINYFERM